MFERFTTGARDAVACAQTEARTLQHPRIGTEHLLLALLLGDDGRLAALLAPHGVTAETVRAEIVRRVGIGPEPVPDTAAEDAAALRAIGIDLDAVRQAIERNFGPGSLMLLPPDPPRRGLLRRRAPRRGRFSDRAKKVLELSLREALHLQHRFIAPEHLLLGVLREGQGLGALILHEAGVELPVLRTQVIAALRQHPAA